MTGLKIKYKDAHVDHYPVKFETIVANWFKENNIPLWGIQKNPTQHTWTSSPKPYGHVIIDDTALGCPLIFNPGLSKRPFVDWEQVRQWFITQGILSNK